MNDVEREKWEWNFYWINGSSELKSRNHGVYYIELKWKKCHNPMGGEHKEDYVTSSSF